MSRKRPVQTTDLPCDPGEIAGLVDMVRRNSQAKRTPITRPTNTEVRKLQIADIDLSLQVRESTDEKTVAEYASLLKEGATLPRPLVFIDGEWKGNADGTHTLLAHKANGATEVECDVVEGNRAEAQLVACIANAGHGKSLSQADRRKIVAILFREKPEAMKWSTREVARFINHAASHTTVGDVKKEIEAGRSGAVNNSKKKKGKTKTAPAVEAEPKDDIFDVIASGASKPVEENNPASVAAFLDDNKTPIISVAEAINVEAIAAEEAEAEDEEADAETEGYLDRLAAPAVVPLDPEDDVELIEAIPETGWTVTISGDRVSLYAETAAGTKVFLRTTIVGRPDVARASAALAAICKWSPFTGSNSSHKS